MELKVYCLSSFAKHAVNRCLGLNEPNVIAVAYVTSNVIKKYPDLVMLIASRLHQVIKPINRFRM